ncbi:acyl-CoA carboxylase subunit epsilon [Streptomyces sp. SID9124]|uniref:acyl-CoA carboxylase subunit epsilon n=1 Tax=Streptomyces sp. SID9124 TaxID=2706108 RepID=UPI0013DF038F|nr:acyl-CoA carboxylase subunit epsilon [Streptomyces sp. SID9124]NED12743.1 acyl-CoA carboxylase subunit epsilon [Streptomyces sp. SID9124]
MPPTPPHPLFSVERGTPDATELAALTAVLLTRARPPHPPTPPTPRPNWTAPSYRGPAAWRR